MLLCLSADHRTTPTPILERFERRAADIIAALDTHDAVRGSVVLATCNRFEAYVELPTEATDALLATIAHATDIAPERMHESVNIHTDEVAAEHLFAVTCGLESASVGESEIAGQVRRAHTHAHARDSVSDLIERLFQHAHRVARDAKHRTGLQNEGRSLVQLSLMLAERRIESWQSARVLLVGTGAYAGATVAALRSRDAAHIAVYSPSGRAATFAASREIHAVPADRFNAALASADLLIACSSVQDPLITSRDIAGIIDRPRLFLDLGMPRNIHPDINNIAGIELLDIETIAKHAPIPELSSAAEAHRMVRDAAAQFSADRAEREALPTLVTLRRHVLGILEDELCRARTASRPGHDSDADTDIYTDAVERALRRFTGRLLHEPSERIRALGRAGRGDEAQRAAATLFGLQEH